MSMAGVVAVGVCSFVLLTGSAQVSRLEVTQTVDANYRSSYDVLVRPKGSQTVIEERQGTVRPMWAEMPKGPCPAFPLVRAPIPRCTPDRI